MRDYQQRPASGKKIQIRTKPINMRDMHWGTDKKNVQRNNTERIGRFSDSKRLDPVTSGSQRGKSVLTDEASDLMPEKELLLAGRKPIREAIQSGRDIEKILVAKGDLSGSARQIVSMARERGIILQYVERSRLDAFGVAHQGMIAVASAYHYASVSDMLAIAEEKGEDPFLILLDGIQDPHNLGAIIRTAECAGCHGVIIPERRAAGLSPAAVKASAGAVEYLPVARITNVSREIEQLQEKGIWTVAAVMDGTAYDREKLTGPLCLVIGSEENGISRLVLEHCDLRISVPMLGKISSLNASVAAGVLMYEIRRQRLRGFGGTVD